MTVSATTVRYIKLGRGGRWDKVVLERGEIHFGHGGISHELALSGDREKIKQHQIEHGRDPRAAQRTPGRSSISISLVQTAFG